MANTCPNYRPIGVLGTATNSDSNSTVLVLTTDERACIVGTDVYTCLWFCAYVRECMWTWVNGIVLSLFTRKHVVGLHYLNGLKLVPLITDDSKQNGAHSCEIVCS